MYWADELASAAIGPQIVNDSKSPSGTVHVGSLRGVVLHDAIYRALVGAGIQTAFLYGVDDMDAMDSQALLTPDAVERYAREINAAAYDLPVTEGHARAYIGGTFIVPSDGDWKKTQKPRKQERIVPA